MLIIFGWQKRYEFVRSAFHCYCYNCQRETEWGHFRESEWVELFLIRLFPFVLKHHLHCSGCNDDVLVDSRGKKKLQELANVADDDKRDWIIRGFKTLLESHQMQNKTEAQKQFIRSIRESSTNENTG